MYKGRINRLTFLAGILLLFPGSILFIDVTDPLVHYDKLPFLHARYAGIILLLVALVYLLGLAARRHYDIGNNTNWFGHELFFVSGEKKTNKWGKPPKDGIDFKVLFTFTINFKDMFTYLFTRRKN